MLSNDAERVDVGGIACKLTHLGIDNKLIFASSSDERTQRALSTACDGAQSLRVVVQDRQAVH